MVTNEKSFLFTSFIPMKLFILSLVFLFSICGVAISQPQNDSCAEAFPIILSQPLTFNSQSTSADGPVHNNNEVCFGFGSTTINNDIWYVFESTKNQTIEVSLCNTVSFDSRLAVYNYGNCPPLVSELLACNDDGEDCANFSSRLVLAVLENEKYLIRVGSFGLSGEGEGEIVINELKDFLRPENDLCENAIPLAIQEVENIEFIKSTTKNASINLSKPIIPFCDEFGAGNVGDVWFSFEAIGSEDIAVHFSRLNTGRFTVELFSSCGQEDYIEGINNNCFNFTNTDTVVNFNLVTDSVYYIRVSTNFSYSEAGEFNIALSESVSVTSDTLNCDVQKDQSFDFIFEEKSYQIVKQNLSWEDACKCAREKGLTLAEINSEAEQLAIHTAILNANIEAGSTDVVGPDGDFIWLGGHDYIEESYWLWDGDNDGFGELFWVGDTEGYAINNAYTNWGNELQNIANQDALCIGINDWQNGFSGQWNDVDVSNKLFYILESPTVSSTENLIDFNVFIYPNPCTENGFYYTIPVDKGIQKIQLLMPSGQEVQSKVNDFQSGFFKIEKVEPGLYLIQFDLENAIITKRIYIIDK